METRTASQPAPGAHPPAVSGDAVAGLREAREFLDVQVQQLAGMLPLVAPDGRGRFERVTSMESCRGAGPG